MKCSICKEQVTADPFGWDGGCNAEPINDGICCHKCDINVVLPARLADCGFKRTDVNNIVEGVLANLNKGVNHEL